MKRFVAFSVLLLSAGYGEPVLAAKPTAKAIEFFEKNVRPVLVNRCLDCHNGESEETDFRVDSRAALIKGGLRGPSVIPGKPAQSYIMRALRHQERLKMPPKEKLPQREIAAIAAWIKMGAPWPGAKQAKSGTGGNKKHRQKSWKALRSFWSLKPLARIPMPRVKNGAWVRTPVDRFVLAELERRGIQPSPQANRRTLLRRITYDLIGLPPTPAEMHAFLNDGAPRDIALSRVVERLLASPRYGERWGRHWLDVARYADSNGLDENLSYANAYHYRDYVVAALNKDKPFDQFVREQIAGDLMPGDDPAETLEHQIATGFLALGAKMLAEDDPMKMQMDIIDEQIDTVGRAFLGLTLGCARCHDHKFDPILTADYYALAGIFKSTKTMENFRVVARWFERPAALPSIARQIAAIKGQIKELDQQLVKRSGEFDQRLRQSLFDRADEYLLEAGQQATLAAKIQSITDRIDKKQRVAGVIFREAEAYDRGNQAKSFAGYGEGIGIIASARGGENFVEYDLVSPSAGAFDLLLRYAAADSRPVDVIINGVKVKAGAAGLRTGTWYPDTQRWVRETRVKLRQGKNLVRIERQNVFPHIDKLLFVPKHVLGNRLTGKSTDLLHPEIVKRWSAVLKRSKSDARSLFAPWHRLQQPLAKNAHPVARRLQDEALVSLAEKYRRLFQEAAKQGNQAAREVMKLVKDPRGPFALPKNRKQFYVQADRQILDSLAARKLALKKGMPKNNQMAMGVTEGKANDIRIHIRGSHLTLGAKVQRNIPVVFRNQKSPRSWSPKTSGRLELANWMASPSNPLTSRVIVNRLWRWHFGKGLVPSTDNFGRLGQRPSHEPLVNWLASELIRNDWSLKALHRAIVLSATYQLDSKFRPEANKKDPENRWLWRYQPRRLEAEAIRDGILRVADTLDTRMGGTLLRVKNRAYVTTSGTSITDEYQNTRRSVYLPVVRSSLFEMFTTFDFADPTASNGNRSSTTVAPQALFLMNSKFMDDQALSLARRLLAGSQQPDINRLQRLYNIALNRPPADDELAEGLLFLKSIRGLLLEQQKEKKVDPRLLEMAVWKSYCRVLFSTSEFVYLR